VAKREVPARASKEEPILTSWGDLQCISSILEAYMHQLQCSEHSKEALESVWLIYLPVPVERPGGGTTSLYIAL
jgi:hypothetical protein